MLYFNTTRDRPRRSSITGPSSPFVIKPRGANQAPRGGVRSVQMARGRVVHWIKRSAPLRDTSALPLKCWTPPAKYKIAGDGKPPFPQRAQLAKSLLRPGLGIKRDFAKRLLIPTRLDHSGHRSEHVVAHDSARIENPPIDALIVDKRPSAAVPSVATMRACWQRTPQTHVQPHHIGLAGVHRVATAAPNQRSVAEAARRP